jgi:hypothetical protein
MRLQSDGPRLGNANLRHLSELLTCVSQPVYLLRGKSNGGKIGLRATPIWGMSVAYRIADGLDRGDNPTLRRDDLDATAKRNIAAILVG